MFACLLGFVEKEEVESAIAENVSLSVLCCSAENPCFVFKYFTLPGPLHTQLRRS